MNGNSGVEIPVFPPWTRKLTVQLEFKKFSFESKTIGGNKSVLGGRNLQSEFQRNIR